jgi:SNF2 family DNA or RNA helicase
VSDELRPYQLPAAEFLAGGQRRLLLDGMRVGKTPSAIRASDHVKARRILWLTLGSARIGHGRMWKRFQHIERPVNVMLTGKDCLGDGVNITSYELAAGPLYDKLMATAWDAVIPDEFQLAKNRKAQRTMALYGEDCDGSDGLVSRAEWVWPLSGTPAPNDPSELWPTLRAVIPQAITSKGTGKPMRYWDFVKRFCTTWDGPHGMVITGAKNKAELRQRMAPYYLRRTFAEVEPDMPPMEFEPLVLDPGHVLHDIRGQENGAAFHAVLKAAGEHDLLEMLGCNDKDVKNWRAAVGLAKVVPLANQLKDEIACGLNKVVLFAWHRNVIESMAVEMREFNPAVLYGGMTPTAKQRAQDQFHEDDTCRVFVGNLQAAGAAIDLSAAADIVFVEPDWTPGNNDQAMFRCTNVTKRRGVLVRFAGLKGSIDEKVMDAAARKAKDLKEIFG